MSDLNQNPLAKYYRAPGINVRLPSGGRFQPEGNVTFAPNGDLPVLPMRGADEILMKSPDALVSGHAIESCIRSCVPGVSNVQELPACDVDAILLAIRASTYGDKMDIDCTCPSCKTEQTMQMSIGALLDTAKPLAEEYHVRLTPELILYLRPFTMKLSTEISTLAFQEARKMQFLEQSEMTDEQKQKEINISLDRVNRMNVEAVANSIMVVATPEGMVTDQNHIRDFVNNISSEWIKKIEAVLQEINNSGVQKSHKVACHKCNHEFETSIEFDPSNFFD